MLPEKYKDAFCEIKTLKDSPITAGVIEKAEAGELWVKDPYGPLPIFSYNTFLKVSVLSIGSDFEVFVGRVYTSSEQSLRIVDVVGFAEFEKRGFFRVDTDMRAVLLTDPETPVRVRNASLSGIRFMSDILLEEGQETEMLAALYKNAEEILKIRIVRRDPYNDGFMYAGEFYDVSLRQERAVCAFLYEQQRREIRKNKNRVIM